MLYGVDLGLLIENNMSITFNPESGDLGRGLNSISPMEFYILIPHVAHILEQLYEHDDIYHYHYAFEFPIHFPSKEIGQIMDKFILPEHVYWYKTDGRKIFEIRGTNGGLKSGLICYLVTGD